MSVSTAGRTIRFGIIGAGLMGREFASAAARWCHLATAAAKVQITSVCSRSDKSFKWFADNLPGVTQYTHDYREVLGNPAVDAVYVAVPHDLHEEIYVAAIRAGKHLMGEKPFGIDLAANTAICNAMRSHPGVFVRCVSQFPFFPAVEQQFGQVIEARTEFLHSSDLDPKKPINWKRHVRHCGEYGVMGDLGMHACHVPLRAGWKPLNVRAVLNKLVPQRPDSGGTLVPCDTWDNATLLIDTQSPAGASPPYRFPWTLRTHRIAPGERNSWSIEILGTRASARFSTRDPKRLELLTYAGGEQSWQHIQTGYETAYPAITGPIFEFGFTDAILQMWAAFTHELVTGSVPTPFAGCATPEETSVSHRIMTSALESHRTGTCVRI
jgi:predicted dehydrogenase